MDIMKLMYKIRYTFSKQIEIEGITFPDKNLAIALIQAGKDYNFGRDIKEKGYNCIKQIESFSLNKMKDINLEGLQYLPNILRLYIRKSEVANIKPLSQMSSLEELEVTWSKGIDYRLLTSLYNLKSIIITDEELKDISFLESFT